MIPHSRPTIGKDDERAILKILRSGQIAQGRTVREFEKKFSSFVGMKDGVATSSGTSSLHLGLIALGIKDGDEVILPTYTCTALLNAVNYINAMPVLVDINRNDYNISLPEIKKRLTRRTKTIIVPHMFGCPVKEIGEIVRLGIPVLEDCAQAIGAKNNGRMVGTYGALSSFSFYATKVMTTGEGGMVLSSSAKLLEKIRDLRDYDEKANYKIRYNYKMTDMQAALGLNQLKKLPGFFKRRKEIASIYSRHFSCMKLRIPGFQEGHIYFRYIIEKEEGSVGKFFRKMEKLKISCRRPIFKPLHHYLKNPPLSPFSKGGNKGDYSELRGFPAAEDAWQHSISIPIYPSLRKEEIEKIINTVKFVLRA